MHSMHENAHASGTPLFCDRCTATLHPGDGDFFVVRIEAVADPTPPVFSEDDLRRDHRREIQRLFDQMKDKTEHELVEQVYRRLTLYLCQPCYRRWMEDPVG
jgi:hypothetical protein